MIYLVTFATTAFVLWMSSKCWGTLQWMLVVAALVLPCLLAGVRDESVGVDILSYAKWMCIDAQSMGFAQFMQAESIIAAVGWNLFTWVAVKLTGGLPGYLFCIEVLCIVPVYMGLHRTVSGYEWLGMLIWLLLEYSFTLNGMRQSVSMGFVFLATSYLLEHRDGRFVMWTLVGLLFHQTAVIGLLFWPLARWTAIGSSFKRLFGKFYGMAIVAIIAACGAMVLTFGPRLVVAMSVLKDSYSFQVSHLGENDFSLAGAYLFAVVLLLWFMVRRDFTDDRIDGRGVVLGEEFDGLCLMAAVGCLAWQLNIVSATLGRVGYYGTSLIPYLGGGDRCQRAPLAADAVRDARMPDDHLLCGHDAGSRQGRHLALYLTDSGDHLVWAGSSWGCRMRCRETTGTVWVLPLAGGC
jgi:hypothetical protein